MLKILFILYSSIDLAEVLKLLDDLDSSRSIFKSDTFHANRRLIRIGRMPIGAQSRQAHLRRVCGLRLMNLHASLVGSTWGKTIG
jgi:hypothetical protein